MTHSGSIPLQSHLDMFYPDAPDEPKCPPPSCCEYQRLMASSSSFSRELTSVCKRYFAREVMSPPMQLGMNLQPVTDSDRGIQICDVAYTPELSHGIWLRLDLTYNHILVILLYLLCFGFFPKSTSLVYHKVSALNLTYMCYGLIILVLIPSSLLLF